LKILPFLAILTVLAPAARAEVAFDITEYDRVHLYFFDGDDIVRQRCDDDAVIYDHATCAKQTRRVPAHQLFEAAAVSFGGDLPALQAKLGQAKTGIERIDVRLQELLATPTSDTQAQRDAIERLTRQLADAEVKVNDLADQVARLEAAIARGDAVAEEQLRETGAQHARAVQDASAVADELQKARKAYIDAAAHGQDTTFKSLLHDRERMTDLFASTLYQVNREVQQSVNLSTLYNRIADNGFVYVHLHNERAYEDTLSILCNGSDCGTQQGTFDSYFLKLDEKLRIFEGQSSADHQVVTADIPRDDGFEQVECRFEREPIFDGQPCGEKIRVRGPNGYDVTEDADDTAGAGFRANAWARYGNVSTELWHSLIGRAQSKGHWSVEYFCASGKKPKVTASRCTFRVNRKDLWSENLCGPAPTDGSTPAPCNL
jgi:hypothetical protein